MWPYLLGHYKWDFGPVEQAAADARTQEAYEHKLSDWMAIEAIVRQRDKEINAANIAKLSGNGKLASPGQSCSLQFNQIWSFIASAVAGDSCSNSLYMSNDVFESADDDEPDVSSRTVSHDKISTITEVLTCCIVTNSFHQMTSFLQITENSTSNSEERVKLLSTQSEPAVTAVPYNGDEDKVAAEVNGVTTAEYEGIHENGDTPSLQKETGRYGFGFVSKACLKAVSQVRSKFGHLRPRLPTLAHMFPCLKMAQTKEGDEYFEYPGKK